MKLGTTVTSCWWDPGLNCWKYKGPESVVRTSQHPFSIKFPFHQHRTFPPTHSMFFHILSTDIWPMLSETLLFSNPVTRPPLSQQQQTSAGSEQYPRRYRQDIFKERCSFSSRNFKEVHACYRPEPSYGPTPSSISFIHIIHPHRPSTSHDDFHSLQFSRLMSMISWYLLPSMATSNRRRKNLQPAFVTSACNKSGWVISMWKSIYLC